jgi:hypothetical protein
MINLCEIGICIQRRPQGTCDHLPTIAAPTNAEFVEQENRYYVPMD